jgi:hypothetical protein
MAHGFPALPADVYGVLYITVRTRARVCGHDSLGCSQFTCVVFRFFHESSLRWVLPPLLFVPQDIRAKLSKCELSAIHLGQDRLKRKYWVIAHDFSRIYVEREVRSRPVRP